MESGDKQSHNNTSDVQLPMDPQSPPPRLAPPFGGEIRLSKKSKIWQQMFLSREREKRQRRRSNSRNRARGNETRQAQPSQRQRERADDAFVFLKLQGTSP